MISNVGLSRFRSPKTPIPSVTLRELLEQVLPKGAFLVSGSLDGRVNWARTITLNPGSISSAVEGDLVLLDIGALPTQETERDFARLISQLVATRIRAIGIQGKLSVAALESASRNATAILYLPDDTTVDAVERAVVRYIMDQQSQLEKRDMALQQELARQSNSNFGLQSTLKALARTVEMPVVLHDAQGHRLYHSLPDIIPGNTERWKYNLAMLQNQDVVAHFTEQTSVSLHNTTILENDSALSTPITLDSTIIGYLSIIKDGNRVDHFAPVALARGAGACAMLMAKSNLVNRDKSSRSDWITAWLEGDPADDPILAARAEQSGFNSDQVYVISTMRWTPGPDLRRMVKPIKPEQLTEQIRHEAQVRRINAIIGQYRDWTVLFLPLEKAQHTGRMKQYTLSIAQRMTEVLGGVVVCGAGRPAVGLTELRRSLAEAERAMNLAEQFWYESRATFFGDLSLTELLMSVNSHERLWQFCRDWLSSILEYDQQNNSDLLLTMAVYFGNNGNMAATAKELSVHRNTLVYRLNRIAEITQLDTDDANVQLNLHLAIKAYQLLKRLEVE